MEKELTETYDQENSVQQVNELLQGRQNVQSAKKKCQYQLDYWVRNMKDCVKKKRDERRRKQESKEMKK